MSEICRVTSTGESKGLAQAQKTKVQRQIVLLDFRVGIEHTQGEGPGAYVSATLTKKIPESTPEAHSEVSDAPAESDSDSSE